MGTCCSEWQRCLLLRGEKPRARILGIYPLLPSDSYQVWKALSLTWWRQEVRVVSCRSTAPSDASCKILWRRGEELIAQKKNNHQWLKVFHEPCLSCWQFCYNHSQHTALLLCGFICCQLPCSYFLSVLVGDSSLVLCFNSPQTQGILWPGGFEALNK